eukprot:Rmarinus@m.18095
MSALVVVVAVMMVGHKIIMLVLRITPKDAFVVLVVCVANVEKGCVGRVAGAAEANAQTFRPPSGATDFRHLSEVTSFRLLSGRSEHNTASSVQLRRPASGRHRIR